MAAVQGLAMSTGPVSRLTQLQNMYNTYLTEYKDNAIEKVRPSVRYGEAKDRVSLRAVHSHSHSPPQARFQQRQEQEREQRLLALYDEQTRQAYQRPPKGAGGKVRQLFEGRRDQGTGWDRSYPLEPIARQRGVSLDRERDQADVWRQPLRRARSQVRREYEPLDQLAFRPTPAFSDEGDYALDKRIFRKLPNIGGAPLADQQEDRFKTYIATKQPVATMAPAKPLAGSRIADVGAVTKAMARMSPLTKKPEVKPVAPTLNTRVKPTANNTPPTSAAKPRTSPSPSSVPVPAARPASRPSSDTITNGSTKTMNRPATRVAPPPRTMAPPTTRVAEGPVSRVPATRGPTTRGPPTMGPTPRGPPTGGRTDLVPCKICGRNFAPDRIPAHTDICAKTSKKKRKVFDVSKQRAKGTDLEAYGRKGRPSQPPPPLTKSNWRKKHEEFVANIRAAKQAQLHVARGGKLSDLPPPPPMDTSDLIPCPHCHRKFNDNAAARHIPKCATMLHNKPKTSGPAATVKGKATRRY